MRLLHKPRGFGIQWRAIAENERVRVHARGKPLVVEVNVDPAAGDIDWTSMEVGLILDRNGDVVLKADSNPADPTWTVYKKLRPPEPSPRSQFTPVKLFLKQAYLSFQASVTTVAGVRLTGQSIVCFATNSGTSRAEKMRRERDRDKDREQQGYSSDSSDEIPSLLHDPPKPPSPTSSTAISSNLDVYGRVKARGCAFFRKIWQRSRERISLTRHSFACTDFMFSDNRLKEHIEELSDASTKLAQLRGVTFRWRHPAVSSSADDIVVHQDSQNQLPEQMEKFVGFIAQEVAEASPESVVTTEEGWLSVDYASVVPYFVQALKEHMSHLEELEEEAVELDNLRHAVESLSKKLKVVELSSEGGAGSSDSKKSDSAKRRKQVGLCRACASPLSTPLRKAALIIPIFLLLVGGLSFGFVFGLRQGHGDSPSAPLSPPPAPSPTGWRYSNYIPDGGFENPENSSWVGTAEIRGYTETTDLPGEEMQRSAPFNPGNNFLLLNSTAGSLDFSSSSAALEQGGYVLLRAVAWLYLARPLGHGERVEVVLQHTRNISFSEIVFASASFVANSSTSTPSQWQQITLNMTDAVKEGDYVRLSISAVGADLLCAIDNVQLYSTPLFTPAAQPIVGPSFEIDISVPVARFPSGQEATMVVSGAAPGTFVVGTVDAVGLDDNADFFITRVTTQGGVAYSNSVGLPYLKQARKSMHQDWIAVTAQDEILVAGTISVGAFGVSSGSVSVVAVGRLANKANVPVLDTTFGGGLGFVPVFFNSSVREVSAMRVISVSTGSIYVLAKANRGGAVAVARLQASGHLDTTFNAPLGYNLFRSPGNGASASDATVDASSGAIYVFSTSNSAIYMAKYDATGQQSSEFGSVPISFGAGSAPTISKLSLFEVRFSTSFGFSIIATQRLTFFSFP